ncbi:uncharacterized protein LOC134107822 [Pungitius pungitius]|uniref:uncharacterized protein LOC134107822 n=1 Tax=Pungitius pungitius TaxID=134920 RepID=UPI002E10F80D
MGDADPDDTKSLDSSDGAPPGGGEGRGRNSDMVHLEREEAEMLEEAERARRTEEEEEEEEDDEELRTSALSVLGGEGELVELSEEEEEEEQDRRAAGTEEPRAGKRSAEFMQVVPPMALPPLPVVKLDPPSTTSTPVPSAEEPHAARGLQPPSILAQADPPPGSPQAPLSDAAERHSVRTPEPPPRPPKTPKTPSHLSSTELLCGGAALVAVVGVVAYGAVAYCRK